MTRLAHRTTGYLDETKRLYGVLEIRLSQDRDWLVGSGRGKYSIADINVAGWVRIHAMSGIETLDEWPNLKVWSFLPFDNFMIFTEVTEMARSYSSSTRIFCGYRCWQNLKVESSSVSSIRRN